MSAMSVRKMRKITPLFIGLLICFLATASHAAEISGAFGYSFGEKLLDKDVLKRGSGMGPHDIIPKKKAGTVKGVQAYIAPETDEIFALEGINTFPTMQECTKMVTMISFFLGKKYAEAIEKRESIGDGIKKVGTMFTDMDQGKIIMITCSDATTESKLSVRYGDVQLTEQAFKAWEEFDGIASPSGEGVNL